MGRYYFDSKKTVEESDELCIFRLNKWGLLEGWHSTTITWTMRFNDYKSSAGLIVDATCSEPYAKLRYTITRYRDGSKQEYDYRIKLDKTHCHLGGVRYWFLCPHCGRRSGKLYRKPIGEMYFCRTCNDLTYQSRNEHRIGRFGQLGHFLVLERQLRELRDKLKRYYYAGKPTRKYKRVLQLQNRLNSIEIPKIDELLYS